MLTLYHVPLSFNSRRVWVALLEKQLEFELVEMKLNGDQFEPSFVKLNPFHHIPVLIDHGFRVIESLAILDYLEAKYATPSLLPKNPESLAIVKMVEMLTINELAPSMTPLTRQALGMGEVEPEVIKEARDKIANNLRFFEELLGDKTYFSGENITLAECVLGTVVSVFPLIKISLDNYPKLKIWSEKLNQRESWQKTAPTPEMLAAFREKMQKAMQK